MQFIDKELLLFDLDGTLIDSSPDLANSINYMLTTLKRETFAQEIIDSWVGNGAQTLVKRALSGAKEIDENAFTKEYFENALQIFLNHYKENVCVDTILYPQVNETLKKLYEMDFKIAIITNKPYEFVEPILKKLQIDQFFETHIGGDSLSKRKPEPEPLLYMCEKFAIDITKAIMIGDSKNDILAAKAANMDSIAVNYGYNYGEDITMYKPNFVVEAFGDILKVLR